MAEGKKFVPGKGMVSTDKAGPGKGGKKEAVPPKKGAVPPGKKPVKKAVPPKKKWRTCCDILTRGAIQL